MAVSSRKRLWLKAVVWCGALLILLCSAVLGVSLYATNRAGDHWHDRPCPPDQPKPPQRAARPPPEGGIEQLALGGNQTCALSQASNIWCWGWAALNTGGQRTRGYTTKSGILSLYEVPEGSVEDAKANRKSGALPHRVDALGKARTIAQDRFALCAIDAHDVLRCSRVVGHDASNAATLAPWIELPNARAVSVANDFACALRTDATLWCWGGGPLSKKHGVSPTASFEQPTPIAERVERVALGLGHACVLYLEGARRRLECFGDDSRGQLGAFRDGPKSLKPSPQTAPAPSEAASFRDVVAGIGHTCALTREGSVWCWGDDAVTHALAASHAGPMPPTAVSALPGDVVQIASAAYTACALTRSGDVYCWGRLDCREPLESESCVAHRPEKLHRGAPFTAIAVGERHVCGLLNSHNVACAGDDSLRQLGAAIPFVASVGSGTCHNVTWSESSSAAEFLDVGW